MVCQPRPGEQADPECDCIEVDGKPLTGDGEKVYLMLNKPRGYVTTLKDELGRRTAADLVADCGKRVFPVGRLDKDSEGLLLFTNDGDLMQRLIHPKFEVSKLYRVTVQGDWRRGIPQLQTMDTLEGEPIAPAQVELDREMGESAVLLITIHQGKNRQIRRMCRQAGLAVTPAGAHRGAWNIFSRLALWQVESLDRGRTNEAKGEREKMNDNVLHRIRNGMDGFSKGQKRIANYILTDCDKASNMTACRLGQITQVSESTVVRFASQLGY